MPRTWGLLIMKTYKRYSNAKKAANGAIIMQVRVKGKTLYILGIEGLSEVSIMDGEGRYCGFISAAHINRLGNGNWGVAKRPMPDLDAFPETTKLNNW